MAWYSGVSGGCCPCAGGLPGSNWPGPILIHWPLRSGYLVSSKARAAALDGTSVAASVSAPVRLRLRITASRTDPFGRQSVRDDRLPAGEVGLLLRPGAARGTAAQRFDRHLQLVTRLERLARPTFAHQSARART